MVLPYAIGAITRITHMLARRTAITDRLGLTVAFSSAQVPGTDGAGGTDGADTAIAADMDSAAATAIAAATPADIVVAMRLEAELLPVALPVVELAVDTQAADMQSAAVASTAAVVAASTVVAADTGKV